MVGWESAKLGEVCQMIKRGVAPKYIDEGGICVINQKCVRNHAIDTDLARRHNLEAKKVHPDRYIQAGDVLVNSTGTGTLGRVAQVRQKPIELTTVDTHVTIVRPQPGKFFNDFFGYMLIKIEEEITSSGEGASGQTELARTVLSEKFTVSYPTSLPEQRRLVAILDEALAGIDASIANTKKNLANARALFASYLKGVFSQQGAGWEEKKLGDVCENLDSKRVPITKSKRKSGEIPYYGASGVVDHVADYLFDEDLLLVSEDGANLLARTYPIAF
jgi:type I restriction enzyme S subunit